MIAAQMNTRIDDSLKSRWDRIAASLELAPSQVVCALLDPPRQAWRSPRSGSRGAAWCFG